MNYTSISDIHLGHRRTPTAHTTKALEKYLFDKAYDDHKVIFICGDLFERSIEVGSKDNLDFMMFGKNLLDHCHKTGKKLRILEGTPLHDWLQPETLVKLNDVREYPIDLKYFKELDIEYMADLGKYVLYIPDEWVSCEKELDKQIQEKLKHHGITQVDIAILHGFFKYHLVSGVMKGFGFDEAYFLNLVKGFIHIGHVHTHTSFDRIIVNSSFDRLRHDEEDDKGFVIVNGDHWEFVVNRDAYVYKTLRITKRDTLATLDRKVKSYPHDSYIRLQMAKDHPFNASFMDLKLRYLDYHLTKKVDKDKEDDTPLPSNNYDIKNFDFISVNLREKLRSSITDKHTLTTDELTLLEKYLDHFRGSEASTTVE